MTSANKVCFKQDLTDQFARNVKKNPSFYGVGEFAKDVLLHVLWLASFDSYAVSKQARTLPFGLFF